MFRLNEVLEEVGVPPDRTVVLLHTPREARLARLLPLLSVAQPELLEAYQSTHNVPATATIQGREFVSSFVRVERGRLVFVGLFRNRGAVDRPRSEIGNLPAVRRLIEEFGAFTEFDGEQHGTWPWFDLERMALLSDYVGRLQIQPQLTPAYARLAERLDAEIVELSAESVLSATPPDWREMMITGPELRALPQSWAARLREWRGIYLIVDESDGQQYVGSAYGERNLLGRWQEHVRDDAGVTAELRHRDTRNFRFSILERVSPDMPMEDVVRLERTWMNRLHTIRFGLNQ